MDIASEYRVASVFGVISPKININTVSTPVPIPITRLVCSSKPAFLHMLVINVVVREEAVKFTILFPIKIALSNFDGFSINFCTVAALRFLSSASDFIFSLFTVVKAVSADEKKADIKSKHSIIISCGTSLGSKKSSPLYVGIGQIPYLYLGGLHRLRFYHVILYYNKSIGSIEITIYKQ